MGWQMQQSHMGRWYLTTAGVAAGFVNGFFGSGGGALLIVLLGWRGNMEERSMFATTVCVSAGLSLVSAAVYSLRMPIPWIQMAPYLLGGLAGGVLGGKYFRKLPMAWVRRAFGVLLIVSGVRGILR